MRKRVIAITILIVAAAVVNVVVAWTCALRVPTRQTAVDRTDSIDAATWFFTRCPYELSATVSASVRFEFGPPAGLRWDTITLWWPGETLVTLSPTESCSGTRIEAGFPLPTLAGEAWFNSMGEQSWDALIETPPALKRFVIDARTRIPVRPIWSGFAFNTIAYAAVLWLLTIGPVAVRNTVRQWKRKPSRNDSS